MRRRHAPFALLVVLALLLGAPASGAAQEDPVRSHLEQVLEEERVPGMAVAIVPRDGPTRRWALGEDGDGRPVDTATPFLLGSVSKSFTAAVVHDLVGRERLRLGDRLDDLVPGHGIPDDRADAITVEQLLTHTSGLTRADGLAHADRFDNEPGAVGRQSRDLEDVSLAGDPGSRYEYSDLNYLLLGAAVEEAGGAPFAEQVQDVARRAGTGLVTTPSSAATVAPGHRHVLGRAVAFDSDYDSSGTPYGYLGTDLEGISTWARAQLGGDRGPSDAALRSMHSGHVDTGSGDRYGHGWRVGEVDGEPTVQHTGATPGYFAHVLLQPEQDRAVVVLANAYGEARAPSLAAIAGDVARIDEGTDPLGAEDDSALLGAPFVIAGLAALGVLVAIAMLGSRPRARVAGLAGAVLVVALALTAPGLLGYTSEQLRLWAPDIGWGLWVGVATWSVAGVIALAGLLRRSAGSVELEPDEGGSARGRGSGEHEDGLAPVQVRDLAQD